MDEVIVIMQLVNINNDLPIIKPKQLDILPCGLSEIRDFVEKYHYSHNVNGVKIAQCFKLLYDNILVGGVIYGALSTTAWKRFSDSESKVLELRRLVILDNACKTSESHVIGKTIRYIKNKFPSVEVIVSYADPMYGHSGIIYRASNFKYMGVTASDIGYLDQETGKTYHSRALRTKYKGDYKPFVKRLRAKLEAGLLKEVKLQGKHCYVYRLERKEHKHGNFKY